MAFKPPSLPFPGKSKALSSKLRQTCVFCSSSPRPATFPHRRALLPTRRQQSTSPAAHPRAELESALKELWRQSPHDLRSGRLSLALQTLSQPPGREQVRVAVLGVDQDGRASSLARTILRSILADPLQDEQPWETELTSANLNEPLMLRIQSTTANTITVHVGKNPVAELSVSSPEYNNLNLDILCMTVPPETLQQGHSALNPVLDHSTEPPTTFPAHKVLLVASGFQGAVQLAQVQRDDFIHTAADLPGILSEKVDSPSAIIDTHLATNAISRFRQGPQHAMEYERLWSASNLPAIAKWLKAGTHQTDDASLKPIVRASLTQWLQSVRDQVSSSSTPSASTTQPLSDAQVSSELPAWSQQAHAELQTELDSAFTGRKWRKLGWWKLFWRVDDVSMLTGDLLAQRFLPTAERQLIYLTGRIASTQPHLIDYPQPTSSTQPVPAVPPRWPTHISFTRRYLVDETIPALQALAQKQVAQSIGASGVGASLAALLYASSAVTTVYEAAAVAALAVVYSLGRLQKRWERAREFWEGEVREEGRKAVKAAEQSVWDGVAAAKAGEKSTPDGRRTGNIVELLDRADDALRRIK